MMATRTNMIDDTLNRNRITNGRQNREKKIRSSSMYEVGYERYFKPKLNIADINNPKKYAKFDITYLSHSKLAKGLCFDIGCTAVKGEIRPENILEAQRCIPSSVRCAMEQPFMQVIQPDTIEEINQSREQQQRRQRQQQQQQQQLQQQQQQQLQYAPMRPLPCLSLEVLLQQILESAHRKQQEYQDVLSNRGKNLNSKRSHKYSMQFENEGAPQTSGDDDAGSLSSPTSSIVDDCISSNLALCTTDNIGLLKEVEVMEKHDVELNLDTANKFLAPRVSTIFEVEEENENENAVNYGDTDDEQGLDMYSESSQTNNDESNYDLGIEDDDYDDECDIQDDYTYHIEISSRIRVLPNFTEAIIKWEIPPDAFKDPDKSEVDSEDELPFVDILDDVDDPSQNGECFADCIEYFDASDV